MRCVAGEASASRPGDGGTGQGPVPLSSPARWHPGGGGIVGGGAAAAAVRSLVLGRVLAAHAVVPAA